MDAAWSQLIAAMQASGRQAVLAITGGGTGAIAELLRVPGGSRLLLEAIVPYDPGSLRDYLGGDPEQACSGETAVAMAERARRRAAVLAKRDGVPIGLGATASLASDRPKHGNHRCHIAVATGAATYLTSIVLEKGLRDRPGEEDLVAHAITLCLARGCDVAAPSPSSLLAPADRLTETTLPSSSPLDELLSGAIERVTAGPDGQLTPSAPSPSALMPGSFNPWHDGHIRLAQTAAEILGTPIHFELSVLNVDKPPLTAVEVRRRLDQFAGRATVELTRAPTFLEKSRIFPNVTFVIGADTAERLVVARYYGNSEAQMHAALEEMAARGARFLVAVRRDAAGRVHSLADAAVPARFSGLFTQIPESRFRVDISSTELRTSS
jgi:nicotinic acid mononucleotide adenylyltransferase/nicotinamide mononucleotide (NMN) deamidase PncC